MRQYQAITDRLVAMLEAGVRPWQQPWAAAAEKAAGYLHGLQPTALAAAA